MTTYSQSNKEAAHKVLQMLDLFRELNPDMPMGEAVSIMTIAMGETRQEGGISITELGENSGFALSSASRHMKSLGLRKNRHGEAGHGIASDCRDPMDDRRKILRLTPKGRGLVTRMQLILSTGATASGAIHA